MDITVFLKKIIFKGNKREIILKPRIGKQGYLYLNLWANSKGRAKKIHRLVAEAFLPNPRGNKQ